MNRVVIGSLAAAVCLYAQTSVYELGKIEVTDSLDISQNKTSQTVTEETIKETESKTVVEALQTLPGISVLKIGKKNLTEVRLRGFDNRRIPIFIDGIPVYVPYNRETDLGRYTTYDISEISVSKGYVSPMYGPNTLGGAVNVITRKPQRELEGEVGVGVFSGDGHEEFATIGTNQGSFYGLLSISNYQRDYFELSDDFVPAGQEDGGKRENSDSKDFKLNLKVGYTPNDTDEYSFNYIMQRAEKGNPYYASDYRGGDEGSRFGWRNRNWRWPDWDKTSYYFITKTAFGEHTLKTRLFYDEFYNEIVDYGFLPASKGSTVMNWSSKYDDHSIGANAQFDYKINDSQVLKIALFQKNDYHKDISSDNPGMDIKVEGQTQSVGLEHSWKVNDKATWVVGLSYDRNEITKAQYRDETTGTIGEWGHHETDMVSPQTALYYQLSEETMVYGALGKRSNMPSMSDRYSSGFGDDIPNPNLEAEESMNYEIGVEHTLDNTHLFRSALFFTQTDDYIARVENVTPVPGICDADCSQYQNIGQEEHIGVEFSVDSYWNDSLSTNLAYTFIDSDLKKSELPGAKYITGLPEHTLSARVAYSPLPKLTVMPSLRYESERYVDVMVSDPQTDSFVSVDLKVTYQATKELQIAAGVNNVFDEFYYFTEGHPEEGRNYYATVRYQF